MDNIRIGELSRMVERYSTHMSICFWLIFMGYSILTIIVCHLVRGYFKKILSKTEKERCIGIFIAWILLTFGSGYYFWLCINGIEQITKKMI